MKIPLYSKAHLETAKKVFGDKIVSDQAWLKKKWTGAELKEIKKMEMEEDSFVLEKYQDTILPLVNENVVRWWASEIRSRNVHHTREINILSLGCGFGQNEIFLAKELDNLKITCVDNAPHVERLNPLVASMELRSNIFFKNLDAIHLNKQLDNSCLFDFVLSSSILYCLEDNEARSLIKDAFSLLSDDGIALFSMTSRLSPYAKLKNFTTRFREKRLVSRKKTGYLRDEKAFKSIFFSGEFKGLKLRTQTNPTQQILGIPCFDNFLSDSKFGAFFFGSRLLAKLTKD